VALGEAGQLAPLEVEEGSQGLTAGLVDHIPTYQYHYGSYRQIRIPDNYFSF
jgi:hypothetical protein